MAGFRHETGSIIVLLREMIGIGFITLLVLNLISTSKVEDRALLIVVEFVFLATRIYCKVKQEQENKKKGDRRNDKNEKDSKRNN